jgi:hypothetical protein
MTMPNSLRDSVIAARVAAERHMRNAEEVGITWREETISELLWVNARTDSAPSLIKVADFARKEETIIGADWLWWWISASGESFGLLTQAKRVHFTSAGKATLDLHYEKSAQMNSLLSSGAEFGVPAAYALYFGDLGHRGGLTCWGDNHSDDSCETCRRKTLAVYPALRAKLVPAGSPTSAAQKAYAECSPLEEFADPTSECGNLLFGDGESFSPNIRSFLTSEQTGPRQVARHLLKLITDHDEIQASADILDRVEVPEDAMFPDMPLAIAHEWEPPYYQVLKGLRSQPPSYVQDILAGQPPTHPRLEMLGGIVVIAC